MMRLLLDHATGVYTGSVYGDPSLLPLLPGEGRCDRSVVAVKVHPTSTRTTWCARPTTAARCGST